MTDRTALKNVYGAREYISDARDSDLEYEWPLFPVRKNIYQVEGMSNKREATYEKEMRA